MEILPEVPLQLSSIRPTEKVTAQFWRSRVKPFDLEAEPPVRFELIERENGTPQSLFFDIHHALADGLSLELLIGDLAQLYGGKTICVKPLRSRISIKINLPWSLLRATQPQSVTCFVLSVLLSSPQVCVLSILIPWLSHGYLFLFGYYQTCL